MDCGLVSGAWCLLFVILWVFMLWEFDAEGEGCLDLLKRDPAL